MSRGRGHRRRNRFLPLRRALQLKGGGTFGPRDKRSDSGESSLVRLRHHRSVWFLPAVLLVAALLPWPYGYYNFLRLVVCGVAAWLAYTQWCHDDALTGWVVAFVGHFQSLRAVLKNRNAAESVEPEDQSSDTSSKEMSRTRGRTSK